MRKAQDSFFTLAVPAEILWDQYRCKILFFFTLRDHYGQTKYDEQKNYLGISKELLQREKLDEIFGRIYAFNRSGCCYSQALP